MSLYNTHHRYMLIVFTTADLYPQVQSIVDSIPRLNELVTVKDILDEKPEPSAYHLIVRSKSGIVQPIDWFNVLPPYLLPAEIDFNADHLLGLLFAKLGNYENAYDYFHGNQVLLNDIDIINCLQNGIPVDTQRLTTALGEFEEYRFCHNSAILHHYAATEGSFDTDKTRYFYREALNSAPDGEHYAFTARQYAIFLTDCGELLQAEHLLEDAIKTALSDDAIMEMKAVLCGVWMKKLVVPYDTALLATLKNTLWEVLQHYQQQGRPIEEALLLVDAAQVANYAESFAESLGYITRAVDILRKVDMPELLAQAQYRRGILLYTWAKKDSPQFFRGALEAFQEALKVFSRDETPEVFADIQQYLGVIYAEIPDEVKKKSIWAGISSGSFQQALLYYTKADHPYEYAMVCNNYANALTKYPAAVHSDNLEKALFYYTEALAVRTAADWPLERAVTLLNYVETSWFLNLEGKNGSDRSLFDQMVEHAQEALVLTNDPAIIKEAEAQLDKLAELRVALELV
jgi:tetratricopeptide (TPR) repeat protein